MKIEAKVMFNCPVADFCAGSTVTVDVDADYVEADADQIKEYVANELYDMYGRSFGYDEFDIANIDEILEDLTPEE